MPNVKRSTFKLGEVVNDDSEFEILFSQNNKTYQYGFVIHDIQEEKKYSIKEEWLLVDDKQVFDRQQDVISFGKKYENELKDIDRQRQDRLYIGVLDYFAEGEVKKMYMWIRKYYQHFVISCSP